MNTAVDIKTGKSWRHALLCVSRAGTAFYNWDIFTQMKQPGHELWSKSFTNISVIMYLLATQQK